jgi:hypothetical protein
VDKECHTIADTWVDLLTRKNRALSRGDVAFIVAKVEACTATRGGQVATAMHQPNGAMPTLLPQGYWAQQAENRMHKAAVSIRRDLEIRFREQEAFPQEKAETPMSGPFHVNIQNANISNLNLGTQVGTINAALQVLAAESKDHQALGDAIKQLVEAVVSDPHLKDPQKHDAVEAVPGELILRRETARFAKRAAMKNSNSE